MDARLLGHHEVQILLFTILGVGVSAEGYLFIGGSMTALGVAVKGAVDDVVSRINGKIGRGTVKQASAIVGGDWNMRQKYLSPRYTTRWKDLPKVM